MLRFHIDYLHGDDPQFAARHLFQGRLEVPQSVEDRLFLHPGAHDGLPGPPCPWMPSAPAGVVSLSWQDLAEVARLTDRPALAALAACAREVQGHFLAWRA